MRKVTRATLSRYWVNWWLACFIVMLPMFLPELVWLLFWTSAKFLPVLDISGKISNKGCFVMTRTILSRDSANWWLVDFNLDSPQSCLSLFDSCPEQVSIFYRLSTVPEKYQAKAAQRWHEQSCPKIPPTNDNTHFLGNLRVFQLMPIIIWASLWQLLG